MATASQTPPGIPDSVDTELALAQLVTDLQDRLVQLTKMDRGELTARGLLLFEIAREAEKEGHVLAIIDGDGNVLKRVVDVAQEPVRG